MSDFLTRLVERTVGDSLPVRPRLPSRFENGLQTQPVVEDLARVEGAQPPPPIARQLEPQISPQIEPLLQPRGPVSVQVATARPRAIETIPVERRQQETTPFAPPLVLARPDEPLIGERLLPPAALAENRAHPQLSAAPAPLMRPLPGSPATRVAPLIAPSHPDSPQPRQPLVRALVKQMRPPAPHSSQQSPPARRLGALVEQMRPPAPPNPQQGLPPRAVEAGLMAAPPLPPAPEINVTIGRIEVRALSPTSPLPGKPATAPKLTLDSYLRSFPRGHA